MLALRTPWGVIMMIAGGTPMTKRKPPKPPFFNGMPIGYLCPTQYDICNYLGLSNTG